MNSNGNRTNFDNTTPITPREDVALVSIQHTQTTLKLNSQLQTTSINETRNTRFETTTLTRLKPRSAAATIGVGITQRRTPMPTPACKIPVVSVILEHR